MMDESDMMLFLVYNMLQKKFTQKDTEEQSEEDHGPFLDHIAEKKRLEKDKKQKSKEEYVRLMLASIEESKPKPLRLAPVNQLGE